MYGLWGCTQTLRGTIQCIDVFRFPHGGRKVATNNLLLLAPPESGHEQNSPPHAGLAQGNSLIGRRHS
jgi:hypothetical protein